MIIIIYFCLNMNQCAICLEDININNNNITNPFDCEHKFHKKCITNLLDSRCKKKYNCCLCNARIKYEYDYSNIKYDYSHIKFNNMLEGTQTFDLNKYLDKWINTHCINNKHNIIIETIGDWCPDTNSHELLKFNYHYMLIECTNCNISQRIK